MDPLYDLKLYSFLNTRCICSDCQNPSNMQATIHNQAGYQSRCPYALAKLIGVLTVGLSLPFSSEDAAQLVNDLLDIVDAKRCGMNAIDSWLNDHGFGEDCETLYWFRIYDRYWNHNWADNTCAAVLEIQIGCRNINKTTNQIVFERFVGRRQGRYRTFGDRIPIGERYPLPTLQQACESRYYNLTNTTLRLTQGN
jgi:hypothetical protein